ARHELDLRMIRDSVQFLSDSLMSHVALDNDISVTNELQTLSINTVGDQLTISSGNILNIGRLRDSANADIQDTAVILRSLINFKSSDNLGDHTATRNIELGTNYLSGDGDNEGVYITTSGDVGIGTIAPSAKLEVPADILVNGITVGRGNVSTTANTAGNTNIALGGSALKNNTTGNQNTAVGSNALNSNTTGPSNTAIGSNALNSNTTGPSNTAIGSNALNSNTIGFGNAALGYSSLNKNTTGDLNTASGYSALHNNTTGGLNTAYGSEALYYNTTGFGNTGSGHNALNKNTTGNLNTASGHLALEKNTTGGGNTASGYFALNKNITGSYNTANGVQALHKNNTGDQNTASGNYALHNNTIGGLNSATGSHALNNNITGNYNTALGSNAGFKALGSNNLFLGYEAGYTETGSNKLYIETSNSTTPLIYGDFAADSVQINGKLNINGAFNFPTSDGANGQVLQTNGSGNVTWGSAVSDNLGDHTATRNIELGTNYLSGDGDNEGIYINPAGNIGIGTTNPSYKFHIKATNNSGDILLEDEYPFIYLDITNQGNAGFQFKKAGNNKFEMYYNGPANSFIINHLTSNGPDLTITSTGNLGIGVSAPTQKLEVAGKTKTTTLQVTNGAGANKVMISDANGNASWSSTVTPSNLTRSIAIAPGMFSNTAMINATYKTLGGWALPVIEMADNTTNQIAMALPLPSDWVAGTAIKIKLLYSSSTNSGNISFSFGSAKLAENASTITGTGSSTVSLNVSSTAHGLKEYSYSISTNSTTKVLHFYLRRKGTSGADTNNGNMYIHGVNIEYTAN
ncbi:hypothetical protein N9515_08570, partial [Vicingaceae bacterium]|nr:hypothetical protein [Vicingaceae bacterium]